MRPGLRCHRTRYPENAATGSSQLQRCHSKDNLLVRTVYPLASSPCPAEPPHLHRPVRRRRLHHELRRNAPQRFMHNRHQRCLWTFNAGQ